MNTSPRKNIPTILVIFGATGDLVKKKIVPTLFYLFKKQELPVMFRVVGFSRRTMTDGEFRSYLKEILTSHLKEELNETTVNLFLEIFQYQQGEFTSEESYNNLKETLLACDTKWGVCTNKLFYLAVPPQFYETILKELSKSELTKPCSIEEGWTRILVEKPFGEDLATAIALDELLGSLFNETQIYRIEHYLAKEMLQNILNFRFGNDLFEFSWGNETIESINVRLLEKIGVEDRGAFYDSVGAFRDVGQNHLLQMLALITMNHPEDLASETIRAQRAEVLESLYILSKEEVRTSTFRAQYDGYLAISGVSPESQTETFFRIKTMLSTLRWSGVPVTLESGKRLGEALKEIIITFKHHHPCLCGTTAEEHHTNKIIIRIEPKEEILIEFWSKKPGLSMETEKRMFNFLLREPTQQTQYTEAYQKLLLDCISGDQTLFISTREVKAMWRYTDPILDAWRENVVPLKKYIPDTRTIIQEASDTLGS